jgi:hypothetical protein
MVVARIKSERKHFCPIYNIVLASAFALIQHDATDHHKTQVAIANGAPVVPPSIEAYLSRKQIEKAAWVANNKEKVAATHAIVVARIKPERKHFCATCRVISS